MSVVGFDIGNLNCYVAVARAGGIETIANEYSDRCTPAVVGFNDVQRMVGISAKNQMIMNFRHTVSQFKRLIGRKYDEPEAQEEMNKQPNNFVRKENGDIGVQVQYKGVPTTFTPEQLLGMLLTELKTTTESELKSKVTDCVISVPSYFTDYQRRCFLEAIQISGVNCLRLMNDTTAVSLTYGLFKQDLPAPEEKPRHVVFVDCGHSSLQVCISAFNKGKIKILSTASDTNLGGRDFDARLRTYFADIFKEKYKLNVGENKRAVLRLDAAIEKLKKQLSSNNTDLPLNIECLMNDVDVTGRVNRAQFEEMCADIFQRVDEPLIKALQESGLKEEDIDVIEIVGGSSRIPALKAAIEKIFKKAPSTTLNLDEAVARGCAIQCAMLSHTVKVRDIEVLDATPYPINISWDSVKSDEPPGDMEVFKKHHSYPFTKMLTFPHRVEPFRFKAYYRDDIGLKHFEREIGQFIVNVTAPEVEAEKVKVKVKLRLDINGCFAVSSATQVETLPSPPPEVSKTEDQKTEERTEEAMETNEKPNDKGEQEKENKPEDKDDSVDAKDSVENKDTSKDKKEEPPKEVKKKKSTKNTDLHVAKTQPGLTTEQIEKLIVIENDLVMAIRLEKDRAEAKNNVEEYVYRMREKIYSEYEQNITEEDREKFSKLLSETEDWLYEDGENEQKQVYVDKLAELKKIGQPVVDRYVAHGALPAAFESLGSSLTHFRKIIDIFNNKDEKYAHIDDAEMKKVKKRVDEKQDWFNRKMQENAKCKLTDTPSVLPEQVYTEKKLVDTFCNPIVNKPKPKVEPPKDDKKEDSKDSKQNTDVPPPSTDQPSVDNMETEPNEQTKENLDMEVD